MCACFALLITICTKAASYDVIKMAPRSQMRNDLLPQGRPLQVVPLKTRPVLPSLAWSVSRQPESVKSLATRGNKMASQTPG